MLRFLSYLRRKHEVNILWNLNSKIGNHLPVSIPERERPLSRQDLVRTTYRTEKKSVPVRIFSYQNPYHVPYQVRVRTKIRTTYRTEINPYRKSVPRTGPLNLGPKIRTTYQIPYRFGFLVRYGRPQLEPVFICGI